MKFGKTWMVALALMSTSALDAQAQARKDWQNEVGETATQSRAQWQQLTNGEELARGKEVLLSPPPNYRLTTDENDPFDLTDGTLSSREDDRVWFNKDAVGWYNGVGTTSGVLMVIDLGSVQPVGQIAIRVLGGQEQGSLNLPASAEFLASADGKQYHQLQRMVRLNEAEKEQSDGKTGFYFPEEGKAYMVPLVSREAVRARYIALRVTPQNSLFADQISVQKAAAGAAIGNLESYPKATVYTDGFVVLPRHEPMVVTTNIATPNWLTVLDNSGLDPAKQNVGFRLELPQGLRLLEPTAPEFKEIAAPRPGVNAYEFSYDGKNRSGTIGALWIEQTAGASIPADAKVRITGILEGKDSHSIEAPLQLVSIPEVPQNRALDVSLAWLSDAQQREWPNFLRDWRKMGFGYVSTFPRYFAKNKDGSWNENTQKSLDFLKQARAAGYGVVYDESPFHVMWNKVQSDLKGKRIDEAEAEQMFTQINGKRGERMNILYRGKYFQNEIKRIADLVALVQPDHAYLDIEWWTAHTAESKKDPRVVAAWKASGKEWDDFVTDMGTEVLRELVTAMRAAAPQKKIIVGLYNSDPTNKIYNAIFQFDKIYPEIIDLAQPSLYVQGRAPMVANRIRYAYDAMQTRDIIPWLSAGTYGEYDPPKTEPMILEAILNGSRGITYYWFGDFDPMDLYYHSKALATLAPFETLLQNGKPIDYKGDNPALRYTAFASGNQALILVGNYNGALNTKVNLPLPFASAKKAQLDGKLLAIAGNSIALEVPTGEFRLISVSE